MFHSLERRGSLRHDFAIMVAVKYIAVPSEDVIHQGLLANKSSSGLCLFTSTPHEIGQEIVFENNVYVPFQRTNVRWVEEVNKKRYAVGLMRRS
jgi:hypothetical protein